MQQYRLLTHCKDRKGIIASITNYISCCGGNITHATQHSDTENNWLFTRHEIAKSSLNIHSKEFRQGFEDIAQQWKMQWSFHDASVAKKIALLTGKQLHCVADILYQQQTGDLSCQVPCIISNHREVEGLAKFYNIPFFYVDMSDKKEGFKTIEKIISDHQCDLWVLARFMQILPPELCVKYQGKIINIHHSFLPAFVGNKPYHQAVEKGVKLIGATCHYVTKELDDGPIIDQDVVRIGARDSLSDYLRKGKQCERNVLTSGLRLHLEDMIIINNNKTIILE